MGTQDKPNSRPHSRQDVGPCGERKNDVTEVSASEANPKRAETGKGSLSFPYDRRRWGTDAQGTHWRKGKAGHRVRRREPWKRH